MNRAAAYFCYVFGALFFLPGALLGLGAIVHLFASGDTSAFIGIAVGAVFSAIGFGIMKLGSKFRTSPLATEKTQTREPAHPWLQVPQWRNRRISGKPQAIAIIQWIIGLCSTLGWGVLVALLWDSYQTLLSYVPDLKYVLNFSLFGPPIYGIKVLITAARSTIQGRRYGPSALVLRQIPVPIGGRMVGTIELPREVSQADEVIVELTCRRSQFVEGKRHAEDVWTDARRFPRSSMSLGPAGPRLSIHFEVPADAPESTVGRGGPRVTWFLRVAAPLTGVDFDEEYAIPVFRVAMSESDEGPGAAAEELSRQRSVASTIRRTVIRQRASDGSAVWEFSPFSSRSTAVSWIVVQTLLTVGSIGLYARGVSSVILGLSVAVQGVTLLQWALPALQRIVVRIDRNGLEIRSGTLVPLFRRVIAVAEVSRFEITQQKRRAGGFHQIEVWTRGGSRFPVSTTMTSFTEAEHLAGEMADELRAYRNRTTS